MTDFSPSPLHRFRLEAFEELDVVADAPARDALCSALASEIVTRRAGRAGVHGITELVAELNTLGHAFAPLVARRRGTMSAEDRGRDERISSFYERGLALVDRYDDYARLEEPDRLPLCLYLLEPGVNNGGFSTTSPTPKEPTSRMRTPFSTESALRGWQPSCAKSSQRYLP